MLTLYVCGGKGGATRTTLTAGFLSWGAAAVGGQDSLPWGCRALGGGWQQPRPLPTKSYERCPRCDDHTCLQVPLNCPCGTGCPQWEPLSERTGGTL